MMSLRRNRVCGEVIMHKDGKNEIDSDLTQIYPMPGGNREHVQNLLKNEHQKRQQGSHTEQANSPANKKASRTLVDAASPLLVLIAYVSNTLDARDTNELKVSVREEINTFIEKTTRLGIDEQTRQDATYVLCVAVDEAVLNTPWGRQSDWARDTLLSAYFQDVEEGADFFDQLRELGNEPARHYQLLKLMHYVLALGYQGRYDSTESHSPEMLTNIRQWVAEKILHAEKEDIAPLSSRWQGVSGLSFGLQGYVSGWLLSGFAALLLAAVFTYFVTDLKTSTEEVTQEVLQLEVSIIDKADKAVWKHQSLS